MYTKNAVLSDAQGLRVLRSTKAYNFVFQTGTRLVLRKQLLFYTCFGDLTSTVVNVRELTDDCRVECSVRIQTVADCAVRDGGGAERWRGEIRLRVVSVFKRCARVFLFRGKKCARARDAGGVRDVGRQTRRRPRGLLTRRARCCGGDLFTGPTRTTDGRGLFTFAAGYKTRGVAADRRQT